MEDVNVLEATTAEAEKTEVTTEVEVPVEKLTTEQKFEKKKKTFQERLDQRTAQYYQVKKELDELKSKTKVVLPEPKAPTIQQFTDAYGTVDEEAYGKKMVEFTETVLEHRDVKKQNENYTKTIEEINLQKSQAWDSVVSKSIEKYPDIINATMGEEIYHPDVIEILYNKAVEDVEEETTESADLAVYLAKNKRELHRINNLPTVEMKAMEMGKIQAEIGKLPKLSTAPEPIVPLDGDKGDLPQGELTGDEILARWYKNEEAKLKRKFG
jgi:hypothetical protein